MYMLQVGWGPEQPGLMENILDHGKMLENDTL